MSGPRGAAKVDRMLTTASHPSLTARPATDTDAYALAQLAAVDSARPLDGDALVAELDGQPVAAVSMHDGTVVADPFRHTTDVVAVLRRLAPRSERSPGGCDPPAHLAQ